MQQTHRSPRRLFQQNKLNHNQQLQRQQERRHHQPVTELWTLEQVTFNFNYINFSDAKIDRNMCFHFIKKNYKLSDTVFSNVYVRAFFYSFFFRFGIFSCLFLGRERILKWCNSNEYSPLLPMLRELWKLSFVCLHCLNSDAILCRDHFGENNFKRSDTLLREETLTRMFTSLENRGLHWKERICLCGTYSSLLEKTPFSTGLC